MMNEYVEAIGISAFAFSLIIATPVEHMRVAFGISNTQRPKNAIAHFFQELTNCSHCLGFWIGIFHYGTLAGGGLVFLGAKLAEWAWNQIPIKTTFE